MFNNNLDSVLKDINATPITRFDICIDMISLLDNKGFFDKPSLDVSKKEYIDSHRVCDIYCKSGNFLEVCYYKFAQALCDRFDTPEELDYFIWKNLLYGVCEDFALAYSLAKKYYTNPYLSEETILGNFYVYLEGYVLPEEIKKMKFDVVVGNPPYNSDMYIDFVEKGHELTKEYSLWVIPAKFEFAKDSKGKKQDKFDSLYQYVEYVDYWQCEGEVFKISQPCGIAIYLLGVNKCDNITIKNSSNRYKTFKSGITTIPKSYRTFSLSSISILEKLGCFSSGFNRLDLSSLSKNGTYYSLNFKQICVVGGNKEDSPSYFYRGNRFEKDGYILSPFITNEGLDSSSRVCVFADNDKSVVDYFNSYCNSRLVRFCVMVGTCTYGNALDKINWRFVPKPDAFDHIFTDEELYKKYNLSDDEITVIESVIRERK